MESKQTDANKVLKILMHISDHLSASEELKRRLDNHENRIFTLETHARALDLKRDHEPE